MITQLCNRDEQDFWRDEWQFTVLRGPGFWQIMVQLTPQTAVLRFSTPFITGKVDQLFHVTMIADRNPIVEFRIYLSFVYEVPRAFKLNPNF